MRKPAFCICENKDADQLRGNREVDQRLCFRYTDSTIRLFSKSEISSFQPSSVAVQPGFSGTWSETPKTGFLTTRLNYIMQTRLCYLDPLSLHFYTVKLGCTGVYIIFLIWLSNIGCGYSLEPCVPTISVLNRNKKINLFFFFN